MNVQVTTLRCPNCGGNIAKDQEICDFCQSPLVFTTYESVSNFSQVELNKYSRGFSANIQNNQSDVELTTSLNTSVAFFFLKLKMYDQAYDAFSKAMLNNLENSEIYFYAAVSLLKGKKAFLHTRPEIDKMLELINAAIMIEPKGIYYYFMAYIKHDYFKRKFLSTTPNFKDCLANAKAFGCTQKDVALFYDAAGVEPINMV